MGAVNSNAAIKQGQSCCCRRTREVNHLAVLLRDHAAAKSITQGGLQGVSQGACLLAARSVPCGASYTLPTYCARCC
jgi:hypothetical protein